MLCQTKCVNTNTDCDKSVATLKKKKSYWLTIDLSTPNKTMQYCCYTQIRNTPQKKQRQDCTQAACSCPLLMAGTSLHSQIPEADGSKYVGPGLMLSPCIHFQVSLVYMQKKSGHSHNTWEMDCGTLHSNPDFYKVAFYSIYFVYIRVIHDL